MTHIPVIAPYAQVVIEVEGGRYLRRETNRPQERDLTNDITCAAVFRKLDAKRLLASGNFRGLRPRLQEVGY